MSKNREVAERVILAPELACYHAVKAYPGGVPAVAAMLGMRASTLQNKLNPTQDTHKVSLGEAMGILEITRDKRILDAVCSAVDAVWNWAAEVERLGDVEVFNAGSTLVRRASGLLDALESALEDGEVDDEEMAVIQKRLYRLQQAGCGVADVAQQYKVEGAA